MAKLNRKPKTALLDWVDRAAVKAQTPAPARGPLKTKKTPTLTTYEGAPAFAKGMKSELFQLAVTNMVGEATFYEGADLRDTRYRTLVRAVALKDPAWMLGFIGWLRGEANMRTASIVAAAEAVKARLEAHSAIRQPARDIVDTTLGELGVNRKIIDAALQRADEPGELLAYWTSRYGRNIPKPVKRGVADAVGRLYTEHALLKYDTASHGFRFGDVLDLTHPTAKTPEQGALFRYAIDRRHNRDRPGRAPLTMLDANIRLRHAATVGDRLSPAQIDLLTDAEKLREAGMTWEDVLSLAGSRVDKAKLWEAIIPSMGYMALLRNLRNFDESGVSDKVARLVADRLTDPEQVARSRQLPFRFYSAYTAAPSDRWKHPLGVALDLALSNLPTLPGRTLVLVDTSASMTSSRISEKSTVSPAVAAAVLGVALAKAIGADLHGFGDVPYRYKLTRGLSAMQEIAGFLKQGGTGGHGTNIHGAVTGTFNDHDRVFVLSDMQTMGTNRAGWGGIVDPGSLVDPDVKVYSWDLQGYRSTPFTTHGPNRHALAGYTDSMLKVVPLLERGKDAGWPWEQNAS